MRALALNAIGFMIIAIASVGLLLLLLSGPIRDSTKGIFCGAYGSFLPKENTPYYCKEGSACLSVSPKEISAADRRELSRQIAAHIVSCFVDRQTLCRHFDNLSVGYVLRIQPMGVGETEVTDIIREENGCLDIKNSQVWNGTGLFPYNGCGSRDDIVWEAKTDQELVFIGYDVERNQIKVS